MNTTGFIPRDYYQIFESLRILFTGGKKQDFIYYPTENYEYQLKDNLQIAMIQGIVDNRSYTFEKNVDYAEVSSKINWQETGVKPDSGSTFSVYYYENEQAIDMQVGSVARTLLEAISWEMSFAYNQMDFVYQASFLETASGESLNKLASMLDIERIGQGDEQYWEAQVVFSCHNTTHGQIKIDKGTLLKMSEKGNEEFVTAEDTRIAIGTVESSPVFVRSVKNTTEIPDKPEGKINVMPLPIEGIDKVEQRGEIYKGKLSLESDASLRERCKQKLSGIGKCTVKGIEYELMRRGIEEVIVRDEAPRLTVICYAEKANVSKGENNDPQKGQNEETKNPFRVKIEEEFCTKIKAAGVEGKIEWAKKIGVDCKLTPTEVKKTSLCYEDIRYLEEIEKIWENTIESVLREHFVQHYKIDTALDTKYLPIISTLHAKLKHNNDFLMNDFVMDYKPESTPERPFKHVLQKCSLTKCTRIKLTIAVEGKFHSNDFFIREEGFLNYFNRKKTDLAKELYEWINSQECFNKEKRVSVIIHHNLQNKIQEFLNKGSAAYKLKSICLEKGNDHSYFGWNCSDNHSHKKVEITVENPQWIHISIISKYSSTN